MITDRKIVVLDDDPTGTQTVHGISVYTDWEEKTLRQAFAEDRNMFFLLTNSRSFTEEQTQNVHREIALRLCAVSKEYGKEFILISRGDSTLRGHFPAETEILRKTIEEEMGYIFDGEILCPFFLEGGRVTKADIHYVIDGDRWIPAGDTEFARDVTFGYHTSNLKEYVEEKTKGRYAADSCMSFSVEELKKQNIPEMTEKLCHASGFQKIIVNTLDYSMLDVFCRVLCGAIQRGHHFMMRTAASFPKALAGISDIPQLTRAEITDKENYSGGVVFVGSHVEKTTRQLEALKALNGKIEFLEFDVMRIKETDGLIKEAQRVAADARKQIVQGITTVIYTSRRLIKGADEDESLRLSVQISEAFTGIAGSLKVRPRFVIAKGGITSSDVATKALHIRKAEVMGQIRPGIPVWKSGKESLFPGLPYIVFPGNVGDIDTLYNIVEELVSE